MTSTLSSICWWPQIAKDIQIRVHSCIPCAKFKGNSKQYGELRGNLVSDTPFDHVYLDLLGPFNFDVNTLDEKDVNYDDVEFHYLLTMVDAATKWAELVPLESTKAGPVVSAIKDFWLSRYPLPTTITSDNGPPFNSKEFALMCQSHGIHYQPTTTYTPTANSNIERVHGPVNDAIRLSQDPFWYRDVPAIAWAMRASIHRALGCSPIEFVFGIPSFSVGDLVFLASVDPTKTQPRFTGPFPLFSVSPALNSAVVATFSSTSLMVSFRRIKPFSGGQVS